MSAVCPNGHPSEEPDYCSVCGAPIAPAEAGPAAPAPPTPSAEVCPSCGAARSDLDARYCEVCRYDFQSGTPGPPPVVVALDPPPTDPPPVAAPPAPAAPPPAPAGPAEWDVAIVVDPTLDVEPDPTEPAPTDAGERIFPVDLPEMLIGRRDDRQNIRPQIPVPDPGVSRRHANLVRLPGGGLAILDLASTNGTAVNGAEVVAGERRELADGDVVTMGRWTRMTVRRRP